MTSLILSEAVVGSAQLTGVDSPNNASLVSQIYDASDWKKGGWRKRTYSKNVARSMVSVFSTSPKGLPSSSPASLMKTSPWEVEIRDKGGTARSRALMRDKGR
jgi:hypothetical protein